MAISKGNDTPAYDLNSDGLVDYHDRLVWVNDLKKTWIGDANLDWSSTVATWCRCLSGGKYETGEKAGWEDGDWNADREFGSSDMVAAFAAGGYEQGQRPAWQPSPPCPNLQACCCSWSGLSGRAVFAVPVASGQAETDLPSDPAEIPPTVGQGELYGVAARRSGPNRFAPETGLACRAVASNRMPGDALVREGNHTRWAAARIAFSVLGNIWLALAHPTQIATDGTGTLPLDHKTRQFPPRERLHRAVINRSVAERLS